MALFPVLDSKACAISLAGSVKYAALSCARPRYALAPSERHGSLPAPALSAAVRAACLRPWLAEGRLYAARNQFREMHDAERPDALSKAARAEMASHLPEIAATRTPTHKAIDRLRGKFPDEAVTALHRELTRQTAEYRPPFLIHHYIGFASGFIM